jgi:DNA polymerase-3 subunit delta
MGLISADSAKTSACEVLDDLRTLPFLTEKRVVLIKAADDFVKKNRPLLETYFDKPSPTGVLILTVETWASNTKLAKKLPKAGQLISIAVPKRWQLPAKLIEYASDAYDKKMTKSAAELLVELGGDDLGRLYSEVDKLSLYANDEKAITPTHIEALIGHNRLFNVFAVIDSAGAGDVGGAIDHLRDMFAKDKSAEFTFVSAFAFHFRRMFNAKVLLDQGRNSFEVAKQLRIWGNKDAFFARLRKMSLNQIASALKQLARIDYAIKTGGTKPQVAAERLVLKLTEG